MWEKYPINEQCYIDESATKVVNAEEDKEAVFEVREWRFLELLLHEPGRSILYDKMFGHVGVYSVEDLRKIATYCRSKLKKVGITTEESRNIIRAHDGGYVINLHKGHVVKLSIPVTKFVEKAGIPERDLEEVVNCCLFKGISGKKSRHTMFSQAKAGNSFACYCIAELFYYGYITKNRKPDYTKARLWCDRAKSHPGALWMLAHMIINNLNPCVPESEIDYGKALAYLLKAGDHSAEALNSIGKLCEKGHYPADDFVVSRRCKPANEEEALNYYRKAANLGSHYAMNNLGKYYQRKGLYSESIKWFEKSIETISDAYAYVRAGLMYEAGLGCERDTARACEYYLKSILEVFPEDIVPLAQFNAARVYANRVDSAVCMRYYDLSCAWQLFMEALDGFELEKHNEVLKVMLEILLELACSGKQMEQVRELYPRTVARCNIYIRAVERLESIRKDTSISLIENMLSDLQRILEEQG